MATVDFRLLSTRPLDDETIEEAAEHGVAIDCISFIDTEPIQTIDVQQEVESALLQSATVVFTSMNAVEAVAGFMQDDEPGWSIYCMGNTTRQLVKEYFGENSIAGTADNATDLAWLIIEEGETEEVIFFCGDQRRDELPSILQNNGIEVTEIMVYETIATPVAIKQHYNGILFFSPSAVESFFSVNKITGNT
ncbi:MAG: uroporphyrinogen-III synthase, partial [Bacteroidota bacterium]|nr:uroporphyrinogen-III synthase [Bacteroidota bacterium]